MATPLGDVIELTDDQHIDVLAQGSAWDFDDGPHNLTYSLYVNNVNLDVVAGNGVVGAQTWANSPGWAAAVQAALAVWETFANIHFTQPGDTDGGKNRQFTGCIV